MPICMCLRKTYRWILKCRRNFNSLELKTCYTNAKRRYGIVSYTRNGLTWNLEETAKRWHLRRESVLTIINQTKNLRTISNRQFLDDYQVIVCRTPNWSEVTDNSVQLDTVFKGVSWIYYSTYCFAVNCWQTWCAFAERELGWSYCIIYVIIIYLWTYYILSTESSE